MMTTADFAEWATLTRMQQVKKFKGARKALKLNQTELGEKLAIYGYKGGVNTVGTWERGLSVIPPLVYSLIRDMSIDPALEMYKRIKVLELTVSSQARLIEDLREENKSLLASSTFGMQINEVPEAR